MNTRFMKTYIFCIGFTSFIAVQANSQQNILNAVKNNSGDAIKQTLLDVVQQGQEGKTPESILLKAIMAGTADEIKQALQPVINQGLDEKTPLIWAVLLRKSNAVKALIEYGAEVDSSIIRYASQMKDPKTIIEIVKSGADVSKHMQDYMLLSNNCLNQAVAFELIQELINHGYNINDVWNKNNFIFRVNNVKILKFVLDLGANPDNQDIKGLGCNSPLRMAISNNNRQAVEILLNAGANINEQSYNGSPLSFAIQRGKAEIIELLLERGANL